MATQETIPNSSEHGPIGTPEEALVPLEVNADIHNLLNANTPTSVSFVSGLTFGKLNASLQTGGGSAILLPRTLKVGMTFTF